MLPASVLAWITLPEITAAMVALSLIYLQEINEKVGEILDNVKAMRQELNRLGETLIE